MNSVIISIGNELLSGSENTNASWIARSLNASGIAVGKIFTIPDDYKTIIDYIDKAFEAATIVILTGGLGPTSDDKTKKALCAYFKCGLRLCDVSLRQVEKIFRDRGLAVTQINKKQAEVPDICTVIHNLNGTAPGLWFDSGEKTLVAMPGVPFEMKMMFDNFVIPQLKVKYKLPLIYSKTILTQGIGESYLCDMLTEWENSIPHGVDLAYLPSPGLVKIVLTASSRHVSNPENVVNNLVATLEPIISEYIFGYDNQTLEDIIAAMLIKRNATLSTAESCTGGYLAHLITSRPGSSEYYKGSVIAYSNEIKEKWLQVDKTLLDTYGAVSEQVVKQMAVNVRRIMDTTFGISVSGIAGPGGATPAKPVGTVWIAVASDKDVVSRMFQMGENRMYNIKKSSLTALNMLRKLISTYQA